MNKRDKLIIGILSDDLKGIKKVLKDQDTQINDLNKKGFGKDVHPVWYLDIKSGLSYTQGYCNGYINHAEKMTELLKLEDEKAALESVIAEKDAILKAMETVRDFFKSSPD